MKNLILLSVIFYSSSLFAQQGFFAQPSVGAGITNTSASRSDYVLFDKPLFSYKAELALGYQHKHFVFKTGISYFKTGRIIGPSNGAGTSMEYYLLNPVYYYNNYVAIPVSVGYDMKFSKRLSFTPTIGYSLGYVVADKFVITGDGGTSTYHVFTHKASGTNSFAALQMEFVYQLNSKFCLTATPEAQYMVPTTPPARFDIFDPHSDNYFKSYTYSLNFGVRYYLSRQAKKVKEVEAPKVPDAKPVLEKGEE